jgi:integrase
MAAKRRFGRIRELPSDRWQVRYLGPDGIDRPAPQTFATKARAERWLTLQEAEIIRGDWIDPDAGRVGFGEYAATWIEERPGLRPKTIELYRYLLRQHLLPTFGVMLVADIRESHVRRWRKERLDAEVSAVTVAKAYRLLKAILNTAADDGLIRRNPCRIKGASVENSPERPVLTARQVFDLAAAIDPRYRALVLLAVFASLRWGELAALRRADVDLSTQTVQVFRQLVELRGGGFGFSPPKSAAGKRIVVIPAAIAPVVERHVGQVSEADDDKLLFTSPEGMPLRHSNFRRRFWLPALQAAGLPLIHFHDLRHTGNMLAAGTGAGLRELMDRMGHSTSRAALTYLHASDERQRAIAEALSKLTSGELERRGPDGSGTYRARKPRNAL